MAKCEVCGKTIGSVKIILEFCKEIQGIKKPVMVCCQRCENAFLGKIKAKYKKQAKQAIRKALEDADREPTNNDLVAVYQTLSEKEKEIMFYVACFSYCFSELKLKDFYKRLQEFMNLK